jgi:hypothetical protein
MPGPCWSAASSRFRPNAGSMRRACSTTRWWRCGETRRRRRGRRSGPAAAATTPPRVAARARGTFSPTPSLRRAPAARARRARTGGGGRERRTHRLARALCLRRLADAVRDDRRGVVQGQGRQDDALDSPRGGAAPATRRASPRPTRACSNRPRSARAPSQRAADGSRHDRSSRFSSASARSGSRPLTPAEATKGVRSFHPGGASPFRAQRRNAPTGLPCCGRRRKRDRLPLLHRVKSRSDDQEQVPDDEVTDDVDREARRVGG